MKFLHWNLPIKLKIAPKIQLKRMSNSVDARVQVVVDQTIAYQEAVLALEAVVLIIENNGFREFLKDRIDFCNRSCQ